ncbi:MAG: hypothetical protein IID43_03190 [Planctomycetes bacterium]|nr:hypothetical protein [Planctomycetota bacterium]
MGPLAGVGVYTQRDGTRVTRRAVFPHEVCGRTEIPIDYHSTCPTMLPKTVAAPFTRPSREAGY